MAERLSPMPPSIESQSGHTYQNTPPDNQQPPGFEKMVKNLPPTQESHAIPPKKNKETGGYDSEDW